MRLTFLIVLISATSLLLNTGSDKKVKLVTGSYTESGDSGINVYDFNTSNGSLTFLNSFNAGPNPSYFCLSRNTSLIYAINEVDSYMKLKAGGLTTIKHDGNFGNLKKVKEIAVPNGGPCFISVTPQNDFLLVANYGGGSVAVVRLDNSGVPVSVTDTVYFKDSDGSVSHAHMVAFDPGGKRVYVTDLGLNRVWIFTLESGSGKLIPFNTDGIILPKGTGPRHFVFNENGTKLYVIGELNSTITVLGTDREKGLIALQTITTLKSGFKGENSCADIHIDKTGKHLYGSNRGENTIVTYNISDDGLLTLAGHTDCGGNWPRNFVIDPSGNYLLVANQKSDNVVVFKIDRKTGLPVLTSLNLKIHAPVCLKFK